MLRNGEGDEPERIRQLASPGYSVDLGHAEDPVDDVVEMLCNGESGTNTIT